MKEKNIIFTARIMSMIFTPFYLPIVGLIALFIFSYMSLSSMLSISFLACSFSSPDNSSFAKIPTYSIVASSI